jgi:cytochrome c oxidase subunit 3
MSSNSNSKWSEGTWFNFHALPPKESYENFKFGMWIFLGTEILMFGGLFIAYFILKFRHPEVFLSGSLSLNQALGGLNTIILLCSSYTMVLAVDAAQRDNQPALKRNLIFTLVFAAGFLVVKYFEWGYKFGKGIRPMTDVEAGMSLDVFYSVYYMTTGLHLIHVLIGMAVIGYVYFKATKGEYKNKNFTVVEMVGLYWHLVDIVWIFLFPLLYLSRH